MITTIQFSSIINYFVIGDELIADAENITSNTLLISPKLPNERTNINVSTKEGNFVFMVNTLDYTDKTEPNLHISVGKLAFTNQEKLAKKIQNEEKSLEQNPTFDYNFNMYSKWFCGFWFCDYKKIAPNKIWTDGQYTYLDYSTTDGTIRNIPTIQEVADGIDIPVNKVIKGNVIVVHTLAKKITIVANGAFVCIEYNGGKYEIK
jgi:type IV secretory pathway VirB9-like protein